MNRKLIVALFGAATCWSGSAAAHNQFEVSVAAGYRFGGKIPASQENRSVPAADGVLTEEGDLKLSGNFAFTGILGYRMQKNGFGYISYTRSEATYSFVPDTASADIIETSTQGALEFYQIGGNLELTRSIFVPYLGASVGLARVIGYGGAGSKVYFSPVLDGGLKFDLHKNVHLRLLGRMPFIITTGTVSCPDQIHCIVQDRARILMQAEAMGGIGVSF